MTRSPVAIVRMVLAFLLTPVLWYLSYLREVSREPLLNGAGILFYGLGVLWLLILTLIAWAAARMGGKPVMGLLILLFCVVAGAFFGLLPNSEPSLDSKLPWYFSTPVLANAFLFHTATGLVFVLVSGLRVRLPLPRP